MDKMLEMIAVAGDFVASAVWHRIIQIVTNHKNLQAYAAERLFSTLRSKQAHETAVSIGGYILGEFGYFIAEQVAIFCLCLSLVLSSSFQTRPPTGRVRSVYR